MSGVYGVAHSFNVEMCALRQADGYWNIIQHITGGTRMGSSRRQGQHSPASVPEPPIEKE